MFQSGAPAPLAGLQESMEVGFGETESLFRERESGTYANARVQLFDVPQRLCYADTNTVTMRKFIYTYTEVIISYCGTIIWLYHSYNKAPNETLYNTSSCPRMNRFHIWVIATGLVK